MRTTAIVTGTCCIALLMSFGNLLPLALQIPLWIGLIWSFAELAQRQNVDAPQRGPYLNSPAGTRAQAIIGAADISRRFCRAFYDEVLEWKRARPYASWDHPEGAEMFRDFTKALDEHLEKFPQERYVVEIREWMRFIDDVRQDID